MFFVFLCSSEIIVCPLCLYVLIKNKFILSFTARLLRRHFGNLFEKNKKLHGKIAPKAAKNLDFLEVFCCNIFLG